MKRCIALFDAKSEQRSCCVALKRLTKERREKERKINAKRENERERESHRVSVHVLDKYPLESDLTELSFTSLDLSTGPIVCFVASYLTISACSFRIMSHVFE